MSAGQALRIALADVPASPWKNGGGITRELLAWPTSQDWSVRLSVADIERDGPFSSFPGVTRWFAVLTGPGVALEIAGTVHELAHGDQPLRFAGEDPANCRLRAGPTRDLNLMLRGVDGAMHLARDGMDFRPAYASACGLFTTVAGTCHATGTAIELPAHTLLWFNAAPAMLRFGASGHTGALPVGYWLEAGGTP